jgi:hypothetical protein
MYLILWAAGMVIYGLLVGAAVLAVAALIAVYSVGFGCVYLVARIRHTSIPVYERPTFKLSDYRMAPATKDKIPGILAALALVAMAVSFVLAGLLS